MDNKDIVQFEEGHLLLSCPSIFMHMGGRRERPWWNQSD